jgi:hypothetical protein
VSKSQRKTAKKLRKRRSAQKKARAKAQASGSKRRLLAQAVNAPFGPCALSHGWRDDGETPELVTAVVTRRLPDGNLLPALAMVDRTCLGIKDAFVAPPVPVAGLDDFLEQVGVTHGGMEPCEALPVQSVVFHALDYSARLGFEPHRDFVEALFGPRPEELLPTPWHSPAKPFFVAGPYDDARRIMARLEAAVGPGGFDFVHLVEPGEPL